MITVRNKIVHIFFKDTSAKVNVTARLEFEPTYYDVPVQYVSH